MYARVPQAMAQFVLKIELLSHIMGRTPMLEMARAYGLRPRLWLLVMFNKRAAVFYRDFRPDKTRDCKFPNRDDNNDAFVNVGN